MRHLLRLSLLGLLAGGTLAGCASTPGPQASFDGGPRSIVLHHPASGETVSVTYRRADGYDPQALDRIASLFRDRRTGETVPVDPTLVELLADLRDRCGADPDTPVHITSGYRSPLTNVTLARSNPNVAENSYHLRGQAADPRDTDGTDGDAGDGTDGTDGADSDGTDGSDSDGTDGADGDGSDGTDGDGTDGGGSTLR